MPVGEALRLCRGGAASGEALHTCAHPAEAGREHEGHLKGILTSSCVYLLRRRYFETMNFLLWGLGRMAADRQPKRLLSQRRFFPGEL